MNSLASDLIKDLPTQNITTVFPTSDNNLYVNDPLILPDYCNGVGKAFIVDKYASCLCDPGYFGTNCQITKENFDFLYSSYTGLLQKITNNFNFTSANVIVNQTTMEAVLSLTKGASKFMNDSLYYEGIYRFVDHVNYLIII